MIDRLQGAATLAPPQPAVSSPISGAPAPRSEAVSASEASTPPAPLQFPAKPAADDPASDPQVRKAADDIVSKTADAMRERNIQANYQFDDGGGLRSIQFVDQTTKEVVRQIPSAEMLKVRDQINAYLDKAQAHSGYAPSSPAPRTSPVGIFLDKTA